MYAFLCVFLTYSKSSCEFYHANVSCKVFIIVVAHVVSRLADSSR